MLNRKRKKTCAVKEANIILVHVHVVLVGQQKLYFVVSLTRSQAQQNINLVCEIWRSQKHKGVAVKCVGLLYFQKNLRKKKKPSIDRLL